MVPLSSAAMIGPSWPASGFAAAGPDGSLTVTAPQAERVIRTVVHAAKNHPCRRRAAKDMVASTGRQTGPWRHSAARAREGLLQWLGARAPYPTASADKRGGGLGVLRADGQGCCTVVNQESGLGVCGRARAVW